MEQQLAIGGGLQEGPAQVGRVSHLELPLDVVVLGACGVRCDEAGVLISAPLLLPIDAGDGESGGIAIPRVGPRAGLRG